MHCHSGYADLALGIRGNANEGQILHTRPWRNEGAANIQLIAALNFHCRAVRVSNGSPQDSSFLSCRS